ncbi:MAG: hypothetical protein HC876_18795 [Chloroflexaceae bacterium]|nr:hypothetical protein [Chloroflexaceae bacterium]NJO07389.1 hypothetical protein [Chloroflexaceae bacterium]
MQNKTPVVPPLFASTNLHNLSQVQVIATPTNPWVAARAEYERCKRVLSWSSEVFSRHARLTR